MAHYKGSLLVIRPRGEPLVVPWENNVNAPPLGLLQIHVGGYVELVEIKYGGKTCDAYYHEEGVLQGLQENVTGSCLCGFKMVGPLVVVL
jgi:hypothetical protein